MNSVNMNASTKNHGLRYVNLLRCSSLTQADTSPDGQKAINDAYAAERGMIWVEDVFLEGVSGSQTFNRVDIDALIDRKVERDDFDAIVVYDWSRMTRGGIGHGFNIENSFRRAGIRVCCSTDDIEDSAEGDLVKSIKHYANHQQARSISLGVARGLAQSLMKNDRPSASRTPYALDRIYRGPDGRPRMLTRWEGRTQIWYRPDDLGRPVEEIGRRVKPPKGQVDDKGRRVRFKGYIKQQDEVSELIPGSDDRLETLRTIFRLYDVEEYGYYRIVNHLNGQGVCAPEGGRWTLGTIAKMLRNPIYLGIEVRHRYTNALFNMLSPNGPVSVKIDQDELAREGFKQVPRRERPRDEWVLADRPDLQTLLPEDVREKTMDRIMKYFAPDREPHPKKGKQIHRGEQVRHKHLNSPYVLSGHLRSEQTGHAMRGDTVNRKLKHGRVIHRYYFDGSAAVFGERGLKVKRVQAEPIERAVLGVLSEMVSNMSDIDERIRAAVEKTDDQETNERQASLLIKEREDIARRLREAYKLLGNKDEFIAEQITADRKRVKAIDQELANLQKPTMPETDVEQVIQRVHERLGGLPDNLEELPHAKIKQLVQALVGDLVIDLETQTLSIKLIMPQSILDSGTLEAVRLDSKWPWPSEVEANRSRGLRIADYRCTHHRVEHKDCYTCSRVKRPA